MFNSRVTKQDNIMRGFCCDGFNDQCLYMHYTTWMLFSVFSVISKRYISFGTNLKVIDILQIQKITCYLVYYTPVLSIQGYIPLSRCHFYDDTLHPHNGDCTFDYIGNRTFPDHKLIKKRHNL